MMAIEFARPSSRAGFFLRYVADLEELTHLFTSYLFNVHRIRVAPTLSNSASVRIQPSVLIVDEDRKKFLAALSDFCRRLQEGDAAGICAHLVLNNKGLDLPEHAVRNAGKFMPLQRKRFVEMQADREVKKVAWLCHMVDSNDLVSLDPSFQAWDVESRELLLDRMAAGAAPVVMSSVKIQSRRGDEVQWYPIFLPVTSRWMKSLKDQGNLQPGIDLVQQGVDLAMSIGCEVVSLGQYTSIITENGKRIDAPDVGLTTGNSFPILRDDGCILSQ